MKLSSMDKAVSKATLLKRKLRTTIFVSAGLLLIWFSFFGVRQLITPVLIQGEFETDLIVDAPISETISSSGKIELDHHYIVLAPATTVLEEIQTSPGQLVEVGDTLLILDKTPVQKKYDELLIQLKTLENKKLKNKLNAQKEQLDLAFKLKKIKMDILKYEGKFQDEKSLIAYGGTSADKVQEAEQQLILSKYEYDMEKKKSEIRVLELKTIDADTQLEYEKKKIELLSTKKQLVRMVVVAPAAGVVITLASETGNIVNQDLELVKISNLSSFKITGKISDSFAERISSGGQVEIIIDKENKLSGTIGNIRPLVDHGQIYFDVFPEDKSHPKFRPNMDVELRILTAFKAQALRVKDGPFFDGSKKLTVYRINGDVAEAIEITTGMKNMDFVEILSGLKEGDEVIISDISKIDHLTSVEIKNAPSND